MRKPANRSLVPKERVPRVEWDFTQVAEAELKACCYYEYARESDYIVENLNRPRPNLCMDSQLAKLRESLLTYALPGRRGGTVVFDRAWLQTDPKWRNQFSQRMEEHSNGLSYARTIDKTPDRAFHEGMSPHFPWTLWTEEMTRLLDPASGLETCLVTIDWSNFDDREIVSEFKKWVEKERPDGVGLHNSKGKKPNFWRKSLEKLAVIRLRHHYPFEEIQYILPDAWEGDKFYTKSEMNRTCEDVRKTLHTLFPFLATEVFPHSYPPFQQGQA